ncbi:MAG: SprT-like domain-containing protein [Hyphomicrobiaceae bacterium]|nr:SprT-like domain-containing protein [Hyphomicrobiaceae bacterium]
MQPTREGYEDLQRAYDFFNERLFFGQLPGCLITLQRKKRTMGYFSKAAFRNAQNIHTDEIALNPLHFDLDNLTEFFQTLVHEMCHLWQHHFGNPGRARYHNKEWADKMESLGLMPSSTGLPGGAKVGDHISDYLIKGGLLEAAIAAFMKEDFSLWQDRLSALIMAESPPVAPNPPGTRVLPQVGVSVAAKKQTRAKLSCPSCGLNVWTKPSAKLICADCDKRLEEG